MSTDTEERCAWLLRDLRRKKGWTLQECEELSGGAFKAVVLGSYERGHRAISIARLEKLAGFYGVPVEYFFTSSRKENSSESYKLIFDIRRIRILNDLKSEAETVKKFLASVASRRRDWNGEVLSLRASDTETLALVNEMPVGELIEELRLGGFLFASEINEQQNP